MMGRPSLARAARIVRAGGVIAYPTEAVYGLGCLPRHAAAVERLLKIKRRSARKGLILIAAELEQLTPYVVLPPEPRLSEVLAGWPGPITWVLDARRGVPRRITGGRASVAVRVTAHPLAAALCRAVGDALVSTSANLSGRPPYVSALKLRRALGRRVDYVLAGPLGGLERPTPIRDGRSGSLVRA
jgi:L-threonylcarbamoyladenylate synthase